MFHRADGSTGMYSIGDGSNDDRNTDYSHWGAHGFPQSQIRGSNFKLRHDRFLPRPHQ
jgi:hypothetical protein